MKARNRLALFVAAVLAVMMVVALVPASVISAAIPAAEAIAEPEAEAPAETDEAEPVADPAADDVAELLDKEGNHVGYYKTLKAADDALKDGYTLKLLADITASTTYKWRQINPAKYNESAFTTPNTTQIVYTIDGNGHTYTFTGGTKDTDYAWEFDGKSAADIVTIQNVTIRSDWSGINLNTGTGAGMTLNLKDSKVYAGKMYDVLVDKTATVGQAGFGVNLFTINCYFNVYDSSVSGCDNTFVATYDSFGVRSYGIVSIFGGTFYTAHTDSTIEVLNGTEPTSGRCDHKAQIFGGLIVNDYFCAARPANGASLYILGGTLVETGLGGRQKDDGTAVVRTSYGAGQGFVYIAGGNFFLNEAGASISEKSAPVCAWGWGVAEISGGNFYYSNAGKATYVMVGNGTGVIETTPASAFGAEEANTVSVTVPNVAEDTRTVTFTPAYKTTCACTVDPATAVENGYDALIRDAEGNVINAFKFETDAFHYQITGKNLAAAPMAAALNRNVRYSFYLVPANGTWELLHDITAANFDNLCTAMGPVPITVQGNGHTMTTTGQEALYFCYANGANLTLRNIHLVNTAAKGRCLQFGGNLNNPCEWTLDDGTTITSASGSAVYISFRNVLNIKDATLTVNPDTLVEYTDLIQAMGASTINIYEDAKLINPNKTTDGTVYDGSVINCKFVDADISSKKLYFRYNDVTVNLYGGTLSTGRTQAYLINRADNNAVAVTNVRGDVTMEWNEFPDCTGVHTAKVFHPGMVQILDGDGEEVATADNLREANALLADGYTLKLLGDVYDCEMTIFDVPDITWEFDGNGFALYHAAAGEVAIMFMGQNSSVDCHDFTIFTSTNALRVGVENDNTVRTNVDFTDLTVYTGGLTATNNTRRNNTSALIVGDVFATSSINGDTYMKGFNSSLIVNRGQLVINSGLFETAVTGSGIGAEVLLASGISTKDDRRGYTSGGVTIINDGTFIGGSMSAARVNFGGTLVINDGNFISAGGADGSSGVIRASSDTTTGIAFINGGKFFALGTKAGAGNGGSPYGFGQTSRGVIMFNNAEFYSCAAYTANFVTPVTGTQNANFWSGLTRTNAAVGAGATQTYEALETFDFASTGCDVSGSAYFDPASYTFVSHGTVSGGITNPFAVMKTDEGEDAFEVVSAEGTVTYKDNDFAYLALHLPAGEVTINLLKDVTVPADTDFYAAKYANVTLRSKGENHYTLTYSGAGEANYAFHMHGALELTLEDITIKSNAPASAYGIDVAGILNMKEGAILEAGYCYGVDIYPFATFNMYDGAYIYADMSVTKNEGAPTSDFNYKGYHSGMVSAANYTTFNMYGGTIGAKPDGTIASGAFVQEIGIAASADANLNGGLIISDKNRCIYWQDSLTRAGIATNIRGVTVLCTATGDCAYVAGGYVGVINFDGCTVYGKIRVGGTNAANVLNFYSGYFYTAAADRNNSTDPYKKLAPDCNVLASAANAVSTFNFYGGTFESSCNSRLYKSEGGKNKLNFYGGTFTHTAGDTFAFSNAAVETITVAAAGQKYTDTNGVSHTATGAVFNVPKNFAFCVDGTTTNANTFTVKGGTYNCGLGCFRLHNASKLTVTGGTFAPTEGPAFDTYDTSVATVTGVVFDFTAPGGSVQTVAGTSSCTVTGVNTIRVNGVDYAVNFSGDTAVAQVGDTTYDTVAAAAAALTDGATLKLLKNAIITATLQPDVNWTFDGNGFLLYNLGNDAALKAVAGKTLTVEKGIFLTNSKGGEAGIFNVVGTLNLAPAADADLYAASKSNTIVIPAASVGVLNVTGGQYLTTAAAVYCNGTAGTASVTINGGVFTTTGTIATPNPNLLDIGGVTTARILKGTFNAKYFLRLGGDMTQATPDHSATVIIDPVKAEDVTWTATDSTANMVWFQNNENQAPTLIIKNGIFNLGGKTDSAVKMFGIGDASYGKIFILGGEFNVTGGNKTTLMGGNSTKANDESLYIFGGTFNFAGGYDIISVGGGLGTKIYGGNFNVTSNGIFVTMQGTFARSVDIYGAGVEVTFPIPTVNSVAAAALVEAGIIPTAETTSLTVTTSGVVGVNTLMSNRSTAGGILNILGGSYTIPETSTKSIVDSHNATNAIINIADGTFVSNGTGAMFQAKGPSTWNITGGTFTANGAWTNAAADSSIFALMGDVSWTGTISVEDARIVTNAYVFHATNGATGTLNFTDSTVTGCYAFIYEQADAYCNIMLDGADVTTTDSGFHIVAKSAYVGPTANKCTLSVLNSEVTSGGTTIYVGQAHSYDVIVANSTITSTKTYVLFDKTYFSEEGTTYTLTDSTFTTGGTVTALVFKSCATVTIDGCVVNAAGRALEIAASIDWAGATRVFNPTFTITDSLFSSSNAPVGCIDAAAGTLNFVSGMLLAASDTTKLVRGNGTTIADILVNTEFAPVVVYGGKNYYAYAKTAADENAPALNDGAQVRIVAGKTESSGLRFTSEVDAETVAALELLGNVTYGTIIVPAEYLANTLLAQGEISHAALAAAGYTEIVDIEATEGITEDEDGNLTIRASLINLKAANYDRAFAAIVYAKVGDTYYYGGFAGDTNVRSAKYVATCALADPEAEYTKAQEDILKNYAGIVEEEVVEEPQTEPEVIETAAVTAKLPENVLTLLDKRTAVKAVLAVA